METELSIIEKQLHPFMKEHSETIPLYPGIFLCYFNANTARMSIRHPEFSHIMVINYCRSGRIGWKMGSGQEIYLGPGDFSIHTLDLCADSAFHFPSGTYEGLSLYLDLREISMHPPELCSDIGDPGELLQKKFCRNKETCSFAGSVQTDFIFSAFYDQPEPFRLPYQRLKCLELLLYLCKMDYGQNARLSQYQSEQVEIIRQVHEYLTEHIEERITIEELSRRYLINPTTLKSVFKSVYGSSLAAHIKEHRLEYAARLLRETDLSIAQIGKQIGYESQSKFTSAFKSCYHILPKEYRKKQGRT